MLKGKINVPTCDCQGCTKKNPGFTLNNHYHAKTVLNPELPQVREIREVCDLRQFGNVTHSLHLRDNNECEQICSLEYVRSQRLLPHSCQVWSSVLDWLWWAKCVFLLELFEEKVKGKR